MNEDTLDAVRSFRDHVADIDGDTSARIFRRVTAAPSPRRRGRTARRSWRVAAVPLAAAVATVVVVLLAPWDRGPAAVPTAEAARVLRGALAALAPRPGWVFHERVQLDEVVPGTAKARIGVREIWIVNAEPYRYRQITTNMGFKGTLETGGTAGSAAGYVWDAATKTVYDATLTGRLFVPAALPSASWRSSIAQAVRAQQAKVVGKSTIDGRSAYEIEWGTGQSVATVYVDATTYAPIEVASHGLSRLDGYWWGKAQHFTTYEYLPPTASNLEDANLIASHRPARVAPAGAMPSGLEEQLEPLHYTGSGR